MATWVSRLPLSLDPLLAEAKRRARQRRMLIGLAILLAGLAAGLTLAFRSPGGHSPNGGGLTSGNHSGNQNDGSVLTVDVATGMTAKAVRAAAGPPLRVVRSNPRNPDCWVYGKHLAVCLKHGRVDYIGP